VQIYLVGGAVRDELLQYPIKDRDYLVTGATIEEMENKGFQQVGKAFPVFLHPITNEEHALARTEKKAGTGYTGFVCDFAPTITVEQDLERRDLTINAMAKSEDGDIVDPFGGQQDLANKTLRHVSPAFVEDPLRVLRVARFAARYHHLGFHIAEETMALLKSMVDGGELDVLVPERVWQETESALLERSPNIFFEVLRECGALAVILPELNALWGVPNPAKWHPEIDSGVHTMMVLQQACLLSDAIDVRFAALCHDFGKALTPQDNWPHHHGHEKLGLKPIKQVCKRLRVPNDCRDLALIMSEFHTHTHKAFELKSSTVVRLFDTIDAWRKPERFKKFLLTCTADMRGRTGFEQAPYEQVDFLQEMYDIAAQVDVKSIVNEGYKGAEIREQLSQRKAKAIDFAKKHR